MRAVKVRDVETLRRLALRPGAYHGGAIEIRIPGVVAGRWDARLNDHLGACGCDGGAIGLAGVLAAYAVTRWTAGTRLGRNPARETAEWLGIAVLSIAAGKAAARYRSRRIVRRLVREIERERLRRKPWHHARLPYSKVS
jgi:hypothetical protein